LESKWTPESNGGLAHPPARRPTQEESTLARKTKDWLFNESVKKIESAYEELGYQLGWRFLGVNKRVLRNPVQIAYLGLNPGGDHEPENHPREHMEKGNWYMDESWKGLKKGESRLQLESQKMFERLSNHLEMGSTPRPIIESSLIGNLVPFRSPTWELLNSRAEACEFAHDLWIPILEEMQPKLIICLGKKATPTFRSIIHRWLAPKEFQAPTYCIPFEYKDGRSVRVSADLIFFEGCERRTALLRLPHFSHYPILTNSASQSKASEIIQDACVYL